MHFALRVWYFVSTNHNQIFCISIFPTYNWLAPLVLLNQPLSGLAYLYHYIINQSINQSINYGIVPSIFRFLKNLIIASLAYDLNSWNTVRYIHD